MAQRLPKRKDVPIENTWKLEDMYLTDQDAENALQQAKTQIPIFSSYEGKVTSSGATLYELLTKMFGLSSTISKLYVYAHMRLHQDGTNSFYQDLASRTENTSIAFSTAVSFVDPELSTLTDTQLQTLYTQCPNLAQYDRYLKEILRQKEHILDSKSESLIAQFMEIAVAPNNIYSMYNNADISFPVIQNEKGEEVQITHGRYIQFLESNDRTVREAAFKGVYSTYGSMKNTLAATFAANTKQYNLVASIRNFEGPIHAALSENNIPTSVYDNLIATTKKHVDLLHDYMALRKNLLGLDTMHMYDLNTPIVQDITWHINFEEAKNIVLQALKPLGDDYLALLEEAFNNRWIDIYENEGKRSGAYSWGTYDAPHPYVLLNYVDNVHNLFTLAHEMGHAIHSYLSTKHQPYVYAGYCIFVAEVASTVNEALLMQHLLATTTDPQYKKYLINYFMEQFRTTLYRQTMFAEFEKITHTMVHEGATLTPDVLCDTYYNLVKAYHGDATFADEEIAMEWARIPHFYSPFYVYQYATGYSAAIAISQRILAEGAPAVADYKAFLSGGSSKDPIDLLKIAGVDMSTATPIEAALKVFADLITQMKALC